MIRKFRGVLTHYLERQRRANLACHTGWRQRVQDIYLAYQRPHNPDVPVRPAGWQPDDKQK